MFDQIRNSTLSVKRVLGIEITFTAENIYTINGILLEVKKEKAVVIATWYNLKSIAQLENKISALTPVSLVINGKGLIQKSIPIEEEVLPLSILPGINPNDFLFEIYKDEKLSEVAIIRKNIVENIIDELSKCNICVVSLSLAFYDFKYIAQIINQNGYINTNQYNLNFSNRNINNYKITTSEEKEILVKEDINVGTEYIKSNFIIAYSAALKLLVNNRNIGTGIRLEKIIENQKKLHQASLLKSYSLGLLVGFLILLLINFFIFNTYFKKNDALVSNYQFSLMQNSKFDSLRKRITEKKIFLANTGWLNNSKMISFYADRIGATIPDSITLTSLNINPAVSKFFSNSKQWVFQQDTIIITGLCNDPSILDMWQKDIQKIKNVKQAKIYSYVLKKQGEDGFFTAEVLIK
jgi:Tfp pilus assembly protein PilN